MVSNRTWTPFGSPDNPGGRVKGSRNRLSRQFFKVLSEDFDEHGVAAIARMRFSDPAAYVAVIAKLMPQKLEIEAPTDGLSLDQMERMLEIAERMAALGLQPGEVPIGLAGLTHEKEPRALLPVEGGGGPAGDEPRRDIDRPDTHIRPIREERPIRPSSPAAAEMILEGENLAAPPKSQITQELSPDATEVDPASLF